ncbi:MAG: DUF4328 domain-containing protein [Comamonadaceae bacterium]|nr:DUF4328 domain-containing protein [Comamonadaceae bacterium]
MQLPLVDHQPVHLLLEEFSFWVLSGLILTAGAGTLIRWLDACYAHARDTLRARGLQHEKWKTWGWMVPFLNLFKPYQVLSEIFKVGTAGAGRDDWKKASGSGALLAWWIFWIVAHLVMMTIGKAVLKSSSIEGLTLNQIVGIKELQIALCLISLSVAGLWFVVAAYQPTGWLSSEGSWGGGGGGGGGGVSPAPAPPVPVSLVRATRNGVVLDGLQLGAPLGRGARAKGFPHETPAGGLR